MFFPIAWKTGRHRSNTSCFPPTMIERVPAFAPTSPPLTGASSISMPRAASASAISRVTDGEMVDMSITTEPGRAPSTIPFGPRTTCRTSGESVTIVMITSLRAATSAGEAPSCAPYETTSSIPGRLRFHTVSE